MVGAVLRIDFRQMLVEDGNFREALRVAALVVWSAVELLLCGLVLRVVGLLLSGLVRDFFSRLTRMWGLVAGLYVGLLLCGLVRDFFSRLMRMRGLVARGLVRDFFLRLTRM